MLARYYILYMWEPPCIELAPQVWEAVLPPRGAYLPDHCVVVSAKGDCNTMMAGGDFDGDLNMMSFNKTLVELAEATQQAAENCEWLTIEKAGLNACTPISYLPVVS